MHERALFRAFPNIAERIPWLALADLPTRVEPLDIGLGGNLWIKRDDFSAQPYGGNKVRKLEFILADAKAKGAKRLITVGAAGSHHALATTIYGRAQGFDVSLILFPQPLTPHVRDILLLDHAYGAELRYTRRMETIPLALWAARLRYLSDRPYVVAPGGSDAIGTLGYVNAALELADQIAGGELPEPRSVVLAGGTLGTAAGIALGFAIAGLRTQVKAVRITSRIVTNERALAQLVRGCEAILNRAGAKLNVADRALAQTEIVHGHLGLGYGKQTEAGARATELFGARGVELDPTYTAKAAAAFIEHVRDSDKPVLFWQTLSAGMPHARAEVGAESSLPKPFREYLGQGLADATGSR
jgi:1-aminocyclopropane-1-carboxylate deaminase/D-cysteine desulfhydrase-like pyridoxal-dependent ACC family enzyme